MICKAIRNDKGEIIIVDFFTGRELPPSEEEVIKIAKKIAEIREEAELATGNGKLRAKIGAN